MHLSRKQRLIFTIAVSFTFFVAEIAVGFRTKSLALVADAFHYLNDLVGFIVALAALLISERKESPPDLSFGWQRSQLLGAFFNGVFLLALGVSIFLQSIERFISLQRVENPKLVLIVGCIGLTLNIFSAAVLHEHEHDHGGNHQVTQEVEYTGSAHAEPMNAIHPHHAHRHNLASSKSPGRDLGMLGVLTHVVADAVNNIGVIIAALVIWRANYEGRFYADPGVSMGIACLILISALPLVRNSGSILLQSAPRGLDIADVKHDLETIPGIESVHELHIWRLDQKKAIASAHVVVSEPTIAHFMECAQTITECLHSYGIHSATLQPEAAICVSNDVYEVSETLHRRIPNLSTCQITCGNLCENLTCCT